ncbi:DUF2835 domain-containing protein [Endothiovibrio diazotrophicus]
MKEYRFSLSISRERFRPYYEGRIHAVVVTTWGGTRVKLPAFRLRPFVTEEGIYGSFFLVLDDHNKFVSLQRIK